jgi:hypothetical protein
LLDVLPKNAIVGRSRHLARIPKGHALQGRGVNMEASWCNTVAGRALLCVFARLPLLLRSPAACFLFPTCSASHRMIKFKHDPTCAKIGNNPLRTIPFVSFRETPGRTAHHAPEPHRAPIAAGASDAKARGRSYSCSPASARGWPVAASCALVRPRA